MTRLGAHARLPWYRQEDKGAMSISFLGRELSSALRELALSNLTSTTQYVPAAACTLIAVVQHTWPGLATATAFCLVTDCYNLTFACTCSSLLTSAPPPPCRSSQTARMALPRSVWRKTAVRLLSPTLSTSCLCSMPLVPTRPLTLRQTSARSASRRATSTPT